MDNDDSLLDSFEPDEQVQERQDEADYGYQQKKWEELKAKIARLKELNTEPIYCDDEYKMRFFNYMDEVLRLKTETLRLETEIKMLEDYAFVWKTRYQALVKEFTWFARGVVVTLSTMLLVPKIIALF